VNDVRTAEGPGQTDCFLPAGALVEKLRFFSFDKELKASVCLGLFPVAIAGQLQTTRVSVDSAGSQGNDFSRYPAISEDGRHVAFSSASTNLVSGDTNGSADVFVHDRQTGATTRVSVDSTGIFAFT
jgi:hypothetical protein